MSFKLTILGSNSATPAYGRHHTSQLLTINNQRFLIDCGEGTQERLAKFKNHPYQIDHIFISHLHGDHYLGLMGLIFTMHLMRRTKDLFIFGQRGLKEIITTQLRYSDSTLNYNIVFRELDASKSELLYEDKSVEVHSFPLQHRIPCSGFRFKEKPKPPRINKETLPKNISLLNIAALKRGEDINHDDRQYKNAELTLPPKKAFSYAFCSDTLYTETIIPYIEKVDLLYHESTFLDEKKKWADLTFHSTTKQAATIAQKADVSRLIIGHFSARYKDLTPFLTEAQEVFSATSLAYEGDEIKLRD
ncbi:MAG: ribonuclease Z [Bacteroidota bacterium]